MFKKTMMATFLGLSLFGGSLLPMPAVAVTGVDFSAVVEAVTPAVVRVNITKKVSNEELALAQTAEVLRQYFGAKIDVPNIPAVEHAYGTGFFVSQDGYILTNYHVIEGADTVSITLSDRTELDAKVVGADESSDIAVLKVDGDSFPVVKVALEDTLKVGEPVLAIGSPFGFDYSASAGIVSAKSRSFGREAVVPFIQSDVALNPGNSGGPLFNQKGEVVGINSRIFSGTGGYMGLSFSIPMDVAMDIYHQIVATGKVTRVYLGISVQDVDRNLAEAYGLTRPQGALLTRVLPDAPADKAGLMMGDVVLSFNGAPIVQAADLLNAIAKARPNDAFELTYSRNGQQSQAAGRFAEAPSDMAGENQAAARVQLGIRLKALTRLEASRLGIDGGVIITSVDPLGIAARSGVQVGDVVLNLHQQPITSVADFSRAVQNLPTTGVVTLHLVRQGMPLIIGLRLE